MKRPMALVIRGDDDRFSALLRENGFEVVNLELITTEPCSDLSDLREKLDRISEFDGIFFTSPAAAKVFVERSRGADVRGTIYALGARSTTVLKNAGFNVISDEAANTAEDLIAGLASNQFIGKHLLFVRGERSLRTIPEILGDRAKVEETIVYRTEARRPDEATHLKVSEILEKQEVDWICFFSPSGVESFSELFGETPKHNLKTAVIGETTGRKARELGFRVDFISQMTHAEGFAGGLIEYIKNIE